MDKGENASDCLSDLGYRDIVMLRWSAGENWLGIEARQVLITRVIYGEVGSVWEHVAMLDAAPEHEAQVNRAVFLFFYQLVCTKVVFLCYLYPGALVHGARAQGR